MNGYVLTTFNNFLISCGKYYVLFLIQLTVKILSYFYTVDSKWFEVTLTKVRNQQQLYSDTSYPLIYIQTSTIIIS